MINPIIFPFIAGTAFGLSVTFHKLASAYVPQVVGAIMISGFAVIIGSLIAFGQGTNMKDIGNIPLIGIAFLLGAGLSALCIDIFALKSFSSDLPVSVGGPIIFGLGITLPVLLGLVFFKETINWQQGIAIIMIVIGAVILARHEA